MNKTTHEITRPLIHHLIALSENGPPGFYFIDETWGLNGPFSSKAMATAVLLDYFVWLDHGRDFFLEYAS